MRKLWELLNPSSIFFEKFIGLDFSESLDIICFNDGWENWEAVLDIQGEFEFAGIDSGNFNLISWSGKIDIIS